MLGKDESWAAQAAPELQWNLVQLPITYLGVPLGANMRKFSAWQAILEKIQHKLSSCKGSCLSRPGKLVLIKAVLSSLPVYYLSLFKLPKRVVNEINAKSRGDSFGVVKKEGRFLALAK